MLKKLSKEVPMTEWKHEISVVGYYDSEGQPFQSEDFAYSLSCFCNLEILEIEHLRIL